MSRQLRLGIKVAESLQKSELSIDLQQTADGYRVVRPTMDRLSQMQHSMSGYDSAKIRPCFLMKHELR